MLDETATHKLLTSVFYSENDDLVKRLDGGVQFAHYTSAETAMRIIQSKPPERSIWLRHSTEMNDFAEIEYGCYWLNKCLEDPAFNMKILHLAQALKLRPVELLRSISASTNQLKVGTYLLSLAEHGESDNTGTLSMWRAYGGDANVCIVLKAEPLAGDQDAYSVDLVAVDYKGEEGFKRRLKRLLDNIEGNLEALRSCDRGQVHANWLLAIDELVLSTKDPRPYVRAVKLARPRSKQETGVTPDGPAPIPMLRRGRTMREYNELFIGLDTSKAKISVAVAEKERNGEVRFFGDISAEPTSVASMVAKLAKRGATLHFCYEAGPTGYDLYRQIMGLGHQCQVVAPSLIPKRPGDRVKTNRRDAVSLARLHRAGELTAVWVPDEAHEAVRDLVRARECAHDALKKARQQLQSFLLRHGRIYPGRSPWTRAHFRWLAAQSFTHPAHHIVLAEYIQAIEDAAIREDRLTKQVAEVVASWSMAPVVEAYQAMRGIAFIAAVTFVVEIGDVRRFETAPQLMAYLGLVPSESSTGERVKRGGITKAGNRRARRVLIEGAWTYRYPARVSQTIQARLDGLPRSVREIAWKAQIRLCARYRRLITTGKLKTVAVAAIAREMAAFLWAIGQEVSPTVRA